MQTKELEFSKLRHAYITVKTFLETESFEKIKTLDTKIDSDLGMSGDDNYEMLEKFVSKFELDYKSFQYDKHFHSEGEMFDTGAELARLLNFSVWLPLKTIQLLTVNKIKLNPPNFTAPLRPVSDLTFKDLITWYIEKEFKSSSEIRYQIKIVGDN